MGGLVWAQDWLETCLLEKRNVSWISKQVNKRYDPFGIFRSSSQTYDGTTVLETVFTNHSSYSLQLLGGTESIPVSQWRDWIPTVKLDPRPVSYELEPIHMLLPLGSRQRDTIEAASLYYRQMADTDASIYIDELRVSFHRFFRSLFIIN